ncbi:MAG: MFS transporter [Chloroflexi bacterium]|nr:MFS transporter [Chloroflexota bacterium]
MTEDVVTPMTNNDVEDGSTAGAVVIAGAAEGERFQTDRVLTMAAVHVVHDTYTAFLPPLLPAFIANLSLSRTEAGLLSLIMQVPSLLQPLFGHLADRINLRYVVILAPATTAAMMSLLGIAPGYAVLALLLMAAGLSSAGLHAIAPAMVGRLSGRTLGRGMSIWMVGGEIGRTVGPLVIVTALRGLSLRGTPWLMVAGLVASAALYFRLKDLPATPQARSEEGVPWHSALRLMRPVIAPLIGILVMRAFMVAALTVYLPTFLTEEGVDFWLAGASLSVLQAAAVVGALFGGSMSDLLGRRFVLTISQVATPVFFFVFLAASGWVQMPVLLALGFVLLTNEPVVMALVQENFPENRAMANGVYMSLNFIIRSAIVVAVGALGDLFGLRWAFIVSAVVMLMGAPLIYLLPPDRLRLGKVRWRKPTTGASEGVGSATRKE